MDAGKQGVFQTGPNTEVMGDDTPIGMNDAAARSMGDTSMKGTTMQQGAYIEGGGRDMPFAEANFGADLSPDATNTIASITGFTKSDGLDDDEPQAPNL